MGVKLRQGVSLLFVAVVLTAMASCGGGNAPIAVSITTQGSSLSLDAGQTQNLAASLTNDSKNAGVSWSLSGQGSLTSPTATSVTYNAPASLSAAATATVTATSASDSTKSASITINLAPVPSITTTSLPDATVGTAYSATLQATGGAGTLTWSLASGALPAVLSLSSSGTISGTPSTAGASTFTVKVTDSSGAAAGSLSAQKQLSVTINPVPLAITTTTLPNVVVGTAYSASVGVAGGTSPLTWSITSGSLPTWATLSSSTGAISGTPTAPGTSSFTVTVTDSGTPQQTKSQPLSITIYSVLAITTASLPNGVVGTTYSTSLVATGGLSPYTWSVTAGSVPAGLTLSGSGTISGTPTATGTSTFTVTATDSGTPQQTASQQLSITINNPPLTITTTSLLNGLVGAAYSASVAAAGGTSPYTWSITSGSLPGGLSPNSSTGAISGTPTTAGAFNFTVTVSDSSTPQQTQSQPLSITVYSVLAITTPSLPNGTINTAYSATVAVGGGTSPYTWSVTSGTVPAGLSLDSATGAIAGTPTAAGTSTFTMRVTDSSTPQQTKSQQLSITINGASGGALTITTTSLPSGAVNIAYSGTVGVGGGTPPYTWSATSGALPMWATLNSSTGVITGTPTTTGTSTFTVTVTDSSSPTPQTVNEQLSITVNAAAAACTSSGNESVLSGQYAFSLSGFNPTGFLAVVGAFTADGSGHLTAGEADTNGALGAQHANIDTSASSYSVSSDQRGCATIATSFGTFTTRFALGSLSSGTATEGRMIEWEAPSSSAYIAAGHILQQTPSSFSSGLSGNYVWQKAGVGSGGGERFASVGVLSAGGGLFSNGEGDLNDAGTTGHFTGMTGTYGSIDSNGRFTGTTVVASRPTSHVAFYMVSSSQFLFINTNPPAANGAQAGEIKQQSGILSNSSVNGNMVFYQTGLNGGGTGGSASIGPANANGSGAMTVTSYYDGGGTWKTPNTFTFTYSVASNGRVAISGSGGGGAPVLYLTAANKGFFLTGDTDVGIGQFDAQTGGPFTAASLSGTFYGGTLEAGNQGADTGVAVVTLNGSGGVSFTTDDTATTYQQPDQASTDTVTVNSDGTFSTADHPGLVMGIIISSTKFVIVDNQSSAYPTITVFKQ